MLTRSKIGPALERRRIYKSAVLIQCWSVGGGVQRILYVLNSIIIISV